MAQSIVDNLNTQAPVSQRTNQSATQAASKMAAEKAGGQGSSSAPSGQVNVMAELAGDQAATQATANVDQAVDAQQGLANKEMQMEVQNEIAGRQLDEQELGVQNSYANQTEALMNNYNNSRKSLDSNRADFDGQMLAQNLRLQNTKYMDTLNDIARRENLEDEIAFKEKAAAIGRGNAYNLLKKNLDWKKAEAFASVDFKESIGNEDIEAALQIALSDIGKEKGRAIGQAAGSVLGAAAGSFKSDPIAPTAPTAGTSTQGAFNTTTDMSPAGLQNITPMGPSQS